MVLPLNSRRAPRLYQASIHSTGGPMKDIHVGMVGTRFMGRAHSNAYIDVGYFLPVPLHPVLTAACGRDEAHLAEFAARFGYRSTETSWERLVARDDIHLVDICTPNGTHLPIALEAAKHGKHIFCEKPLAMNADEARQMYEAAEGAGVTHMVAFNYRRVPAVALAKQMAEQGSLGRIYHFNAVYYQDWLADPAYPYVWRNDVLQAGSGAHGDLNAHTVDLARYLVGEFEAVSGAQQVFIEQRAKQDGAMGQVTADDATGFLARFQNGALGVFMATRLATGRKNFLRFELFGSKGSLVFNLERLNELEFFSSEDPDGAQGFRTILVTAKSHPYLAAWWPPGHIIGWEHTFIHETYDLLVAIDGGKPAIPDFRDGWKCQQVLDAVQESAAESGWIALRQS
jgi:predicted dehydrogenase